MADFKKAFTMRLREDLSETLDVLSEMEHRSKTNILELAFINYVKDYEEKNGKIIKCSKENS